MKLKIGRNLKASGDARLLQIALSNLLSNAWKFTGRKPNATVELDSIHKDGKGVFFVRDNGIVQRIIQRHGGHIWAEVKRGEGAAFYFTLGN